MTTVLNSQVLVLNKNYVPINIVTVREAIKKLVKGRAEVVSIEDTAYTGYNFDSWIEMSFLKSQFGLESNEEIIGNEEFSIVAPTIIRVLNYDKSYQQQVRFSRRNVFIRDKNICQFCGKKFPLDELTWDHVIPRARGGSTSWENIVCSCYKCNNKKGCRTPEEAGMKLLHKPIKPNVFITFEVPIEGIKKYKSWDKFVSSLYWNVELKD